jgi:hypothetical protein
MIALFALTTVLLASAPTSPPAAASEPTVRPSPVAMSPDELFSRRALRRARLLIQMRVLQLRDQRLECIREALARQLPDALWVEEPAPGRPAASAAEAATRCSQLLRF